MKKFIFVLTVISFSLSFGLESCKKDAVSPSANAMDNEILTLINNHRKSLSLTELQYNEIIFQQALIHSTNMANGTTAFGHDGFETRIANIKTSLGGGSSAGENVAMGYTSAQAVVDGWLNSPGHKANIEGNYNLTGISSYKKADGAYYFTQIFLKK